MSKESDTQELIGCVFGYIIASYPINWVFLNLFITPRYQRMSEPLSDDMFSALMFLSPISLPIELMTETLHGLFVLFDYVLGR